MNCRFADFRCKEVINICDGCRLGYVGDVECRLPDGQLTALIIPGRTAFSGCSAGERNTASHGSVSSRSGTISFSLTSPFCARRSRAESTARAAAGTEKGGGRKVPQ